MDMRFVVGDTLKVVNLDSENHQLGPLWIPAGTYLELKLRDRRKFDVRMHIPKRQLFGYQYSRACDLAHACFRNFLCGLPNGHDVCGLQRLNRRSKEKGK